MSAVSPITLSICTFTLLTLYFKSISLCFKENHSFYLQRTHPTPTFLYTCHQFCSLIFLFLLDTQGNIPSVLLALSSACSEREADWKELNNEAQKLSREGLSGTASSHCQVLVTSIF